MKLLLHHFLENSASLYPEKIAVIHDKERISYLQLNHKAENLALCLKSNGIVTGDRVALLFENSVDYIIAYYAASKLGAVTAPLNPGLKPDGLQYLLDDLEPAVIITNYRCERLLKAVNLDNSITNLIIIKNPKQKWSGLSIPVIAFEDSILEQGALLPQNNIVPNDLANIIYTSGSTGEPKGVMLSHHNLVSNIQSICKYLSLNKEDIQMVVLPFFYVMGKSLLNTHMAVGGSLVINNRFLYPADVVNQMIDENVTGFSGVPSTFAYLLNRSPLASCRDKLSSLRYCSQAGGHMALSIKQNLRNSLPPHTQIYIMYGATEASARLTYLAPNYYKQKTESIGKPISNVSISILDDNGVEVPDGQEGELVASGPNIMKGYWKDPKETAHVLTSKGYHTGDIGYRDSDGFLFVKRRKDGLIKTGGHRVNPTEIEDVLMATDQLIETIVVGIPDDLLGKKLIALAVPNNEDCSPKFLIEACQKSLPRHKLPEDIFFIRVLPKNANGKLDRAKCIEMAQKRLFHNK
jgi:acyl-CoA synthetase (AMP-forming)/AMP-acid ligase II